MTTRSYYNLLGVPYNCSQVELTKAYRKLAIQFHPDKNPEGCERFKDITRAYKVLSDPNNRRTYDLGGEEAMKNGISKMFAAFNFSWGDLDLLLKKYNGNIANVKVAKSPNTIHEIYVSLEDIYVGNSVEKTVDKTCNCVNCRGLGVTLGTERCLDCGGMGKNSEMVVCVTCQGKCLQSVLCTTCEGVKFYTTSKKYVIQLKKGMLEGQEVSFTSEGDELPGSGPGDRIFKVKYSEHPHYRRENIIKLIRTVDITLKEAILGFRKSIMSLDNRRLVITREPSDKIITSGTRNIVEKEGMPDIFNPEKHGKLVLEYRVNYPKRLTQEQLSALTSLLQPKIGPTHRCCRAVFLKDVCKELDAIKSEVFPLKCCPVHECNCHN